ncbi:MAG TPA: YgaP-like transmembrane domain, partial [Candidatus Nanopelagicales bacterium]
MSLSLGPLRSAAGRGRRPQLVRTVGREDRLVRACVALSLLLLGGFALLLSGELGVISLLFVVLLGYFAGTAAVGWDPIYARTGIDTRSHRELASAPAAAWPVALGDSPVLDLTDGARGAATVSQWQDEGTG